MKKIFTTLILLLLIFVFLGCQIHTYKAGKGAVSFSPAKGKVVKEIKTSGKGWSFLFTSIGPDIDVSKKLGIKDNQSIANLKIEQSQSFIDSFLGLLTLYIAAPNSYSLKADLVESNN